VSDGALSNWCNDLKTPTIDALAKIASYFKVSADYLLGLSQAQTTNIELKAICEYTGLSEDALESLNFIKHELAGPELFRRSVLLDVLDDVLRNPDHYGVDQHIWSAALAGIEFMRYNEEPISHRSDYLKYDVQMLLLHLDKTKNSGADGLFTIPAQDALLWYSNKAVEELSQVFTKAVEREVNQAICDLLGDDRVKFYTELHDKKEDKNNATENNT
jgi:transcriptional regulator with XRE-family HTH domain